MADAAIFSRPDNIITQIMQVSGRTLFRRVNLRTRSSEYLSQRTIQMLEEMQFVIPGNDTTRMAEHAKSVIMASQELLSRLQKGTRTDEIWGEQTVAGNAGFLVWILSERRSDKSIIENALGVARQAYLFEATQRGQAHDASLGITHMLTTILKANISTTFVTTLRQDIVTCLRILLDEEQASRTIDVSQGKTPEMDSCSLARGMAATIANRLADWPEIQDRMVRGLKNRGMPLRFILCTKTYHPHP